MASPTALVKRLLIGRPSRSDRMPHVAPELTPVDERQVPPARHHAVVLDGVRPLVRGSRADAASLVPPQPAANSPAENVVPVQ